MSKETVRDLKKKDIFKFTLFLSVSNTNNKHLSFNWIEYINLLCYSIR